MNSESSSTEFGKDIIFGEIVSLVSNKVASSDVSSENYISTENMLPNCGGVTIASSLPNAKNLTGFAKVIPYFQI